MWCNRAEIREEAADGNQNNDDCDGLMMILATVGISRPRVAGHVYDCYNDEQHRNHCSALICKVGSLGCALAVYGEGVGQR